MSGLNNKAYQKHLTSSRDLETSYEAVRAGFIAMALEKNRRATPYIDGARALRHQIATVNNPDHLLPMQEIEAALLTAAGLSDKAQKHLQPDDKKRAIEHLINEFLRPAGDTFAEELVFRFLLFRGDALGGTMRNLAGALAQRKVTRTIMAILSNAGLRYKWQDGRSGKWFTQSDADVEIDQTLRGLSWQHPKGFRTMLYNFTPPIVKNNVDMCLLHCAPEHIATTAASATAYLALGELKGGIDPAGADEHWKTARAALNRIRDTFAAANATPHLFFIGAAIEQRMADEIWADLSAGRLSNAANLTNDHQLTAIAQWLCSL
ncbi:restriction endonuclease [Chloroflexus islandicus]|uniref:Restriction endonuclease n=1 Tax=Chloroflexus islandicus TaxID=1707952 RepID=A0A178MAY7_9CHLR|nr:AvaI/BsoBI family type II restriction endonuclease [Chloroflexus islandicus]OAN45950.1 restriction endonuclease [Chloroflexus islandicus]